MIRYFEREDVSEHMCRDGIWGADYKFCINRRNIKCWGLHWKQNGVPAGILSLTQPVQWGIFS